MSDIISAINDDMEEYESLCKRYGEKPRYSPDSRGYPLLDCYGKHAEALKEKRDQEREKYNKKAI